MTMRLNFPRKSDYAHYLRAGGYQTALSEMHFIGPDQFHGLKNV